MNILICWIGLADLAASEKDDASGLNPIAQAVKVHALNDTLRRNLFAPKALG